MPLHCLSTKSFPYPYPSLLLSLCADYMYICWVCAVEWHLYFVYNFLIYPRYYNNARSTCYIVIHYTKRLHFARYSRCCEVKQVGGVEKNERHIVTLLTINAPNVKYNVM